MGKRHVSQYANFGSLQARIQSAEKASKNIYNYFYGDKNELNVV